MAPNLKALPAETLAELEKICHPRRFASGHAVMDVGQSPSFVGCVTEGILRMQKTLPDGTEHIVGLLIEGDVFGLAFAGPIHFAIEAATDVEIATFPRAAFEALMTRAPELERAVLLNTLDELDRARDWMMILGNRKVAGRLAGFLLVLCTKYGEAEHLLSAGRRGMKVKVPISRADLANLLGTRPESLSRAYHALADDGVIAIKSPAEVEILDFEALIQASGEEDPENAQALEDLARSLGRPAR